MKQLLNVLKYTLLLSFSGLLMWYAVRGQDLSRIGQYMREANYFWMGITVVLSALGYFSRAYRWKMQIDATGHRTPYWDVYHAMMTGYLANLALPRLGEVLRCSVLRRTSGVPVEVGVGTMITERIIDVLILLSLLGAVLLLQFDKFWSFISGLLSDKYASFARNETTLLAIALIGLALLVLTLFLLFRNLERLRQNALFNKAFLFARGLLSAIFSIRKIENKGLFLLHTVATWGIYYLMDYLAFFAFPETQNLGVVAGLAVLTFGAFGMATPVQGGIGVFHVMVQATLLVYGVSKEAGIAYALVVHGSQTLLVVLMGGISFVVSMIKSGRVSRAVVPASVTVATPAHVD
ncbi:flippase-like domain-containing protein [Hymenobacter sp. BT175]|uniref:lysylphosphatidylglycerol synthase transmembrane domain-containing protein n=1 Tax=Hymenobacter translucens TaxID=2886507 RepID=UPI001D0E9436|nr:lysylphosphatidylglycerol synthase transmembrane domain-containing protein [Hymenobacter translucens]MCC2545781.1 flippase-like domain-containing protein [Hymenobacter translucens]